MAYNSFEDLEVWKRSCDVTVKVFAKLSGWKEYGLKDQMTRAAVSIASNIAEGAERGTIPDFIRFLHIAKGSAAELRTQIYIASKTGYLNKSFEEEITKELKEISSMIQGLISSLRSKSS